MNLLPLQQVQSIGQRTSIPQDENFLAEHITLTSWGGTLIIYPCA